MLARSRGVPMVVGLGACIDGPFGQALVDGDAAGVIFDPSEPSRARFRSGSTLRSAAAGAGFRMSASRCRPRRATAVAIAVHVNIADPSELDALDPAICDGIGLMRTEFLFPADELPDEETQYAPIAGCVGMGAPAAGDHPHARCRRRQAGRRAHHRRREQSVPRPARHPAVAGASGGLSACSSGAARAAVHRRSQGHAADGHGAERASRRRGAASRRGGRRSARRASPRRRPPLGIMVEVPAVAIAPELFRGRLLLDRLERPDPICDGRGPRQRRRARRTRRSAQPGRAAPDRGGLPRIGRGTGIAVSLCGDAGGDPASIPALLAAGLRDLSVAPARWLGQGQVGHRRRVDRRRHDRRPRTTAWATGASRGRRLQDDPAARHRQAAVRHAPAPRRRARQEPQLRLADRQPGLSDADPGAAHRDDLRGLPFLARANAAHFLAAYHRAHPGALPVAQAAPIARLSAHRSPISATTKQQRAARPRGRTTSSRRSPTSPAESGSAASSDCEGGQP